MEIEIQVSDVRELVEQNDGEVTDVGYESFGSYTKAFVEAYFEERGEVPTLYMFEDAENVVVDDDWDAANNGVMYEVTLAEREADS